MDKLDDGLILILMLEEFRLSTTCNFDD